MTRNSPTAGTSERQSPVRLDAGSTEIARERARGSGDERPEHAAPAPPASIGEAETPSNVMVGIPAYNESGSIAEVVTAARRHADTVVVVDDGSDDGTGERALEAGVTVIDHRVNRGYGATLETIFQHALDAGVDHLVTLDGDGQHDPADIPPLLDALRSGSADIAVGSRFVSGSDTHLPTYRRVGLAVVNTLTNAGTRLRYSTSTVVDTQSGFRAYRRDAIETVARDGDLGEGMGASLDLLFHAAREGLEVTEVPTTVDYDIDDPSTQNPVAHGLVLCRAIFREVIPTRTARIAVGSVVAFLTSFAAVVVYGRFGGTIAHSAGVLLVGFAAVVGLIFPNATRGWRDFAGR